MRIENPSFADNAPIPAQFAFGIANAKQHVTLSANRNPHLRWSDAPAGTKSFVLICHDPDVPSKGDDVNQEGRTVPASLPRVDFYHWILVDIPPHISEVKAAEYSNGVTPRGKAGPLAPHGARHGINDYTGWFAGDPDMRGDYYGYDGPCPPWNDELPHRYVFTIYAVDIERLPLEGRFGGGEARAALQGHVLAEASSTGCYTLNPAVKL